MVNDYILKHYRNVLNNEKNFLKQSGLNLDFNNIDKLRKIRNSIDNYLETLEEKESRETFINN